MSSGIWGPLYGQILREALLESLKTPCPKLKHSHEEIDGWTYSILQKFTAPSWATPRWNPMTDTMSHGMWIEAIGVELLAHCWHLNINDAQQSVYRLAIKGLIKRKYWHPLWYDDCEPWPRWEVVDPLTALASNV